MSDEKLLPIILDVTQTESVAAAFQEISTRIGDNGLVGLVNNAGVAVFGPVEQVPIGIVEEQFRVNFFGVVAVTQRFLPLLRRARGRVINISSVNGRLSTPFAGIYSASKFALEAVSDALRMELKPWGITVSVVEPGVTATDARAFAMQRWSEHRQSLPDEQRKLYEPVFVKTRELIANLEKSAAGHEEVTNAVVDALTSDTPKPRSMVGPDARRWTEMIGLPDKERDEALLRLWQ